MKTIYEVQYIRKDGSFGAYCGSSKEAYEKEIDNCERAKYVYTASIKTQDNGAGCPALPAKSYDAIAQTAKELNCNLAEIFDELDEYHEDFLIGYLQSRCGYTVSQLPQIRRAEYTSVWNDGFQVSSPCYVDMAERKVFNIEPSGIEYDEDGDELEYFEEEFVTISGVKYPVCLASDADDGYAPANWNPDRDYTRD